MSAQILELRIKLSDRMQTIADRVAAGETVADIGTDHGQIPVWLFARGISPRVILSDISEGSIQKAKETAAAYQFGEGLSFRVGNGLKVLEPGEVDTVIIAGMGGKLIRDILSHDPDHTATFRKLILQPRKGMGPLRKWLLENDYRIISEDVVWESHFLPEIITAVSPAFAADRIDRAACGDSADCAAEDLAAGQREQLAGLPETDIRLRVPPWMIRAGGPVLDYLNMRRYQEQLVLSNMQRAKTRNAEAEARVAANIRYLEQLREEI